MIKPNIMATNDQSIIEKLSKELDQLKNELDEKKREYDQVEFKYGFVKNLIDDCLASDSTAVTKVKSEGNKISMINRDDKMVTLLEKLDASVKRAELMAEFEKEYRFNTNLSNIIKKMRKKGDLVSVKYDGQNQKVYYGLPKWLDMDKNDFTEMYKPEEYIDRIVKTEVVGIKKTKEKPPL